LPIDRPQTYPAEARLETALEAGKLGYWELDSERRLTGSAMLDRNFGLPAGHTLTWDTLLAAVHDGDRVRLTETLDAALASGEPIDTEIRVNWPDGDTHWLRMRGQCAAVEPGRPARLIGITFDITDRKANERRMREDAAERRLFESRQRLLMDELNHRVRNTLAIVLGIANQTLRHASSSAQFRTDFEARVTALAAAHNLLTESNWEGAPLRDIADSVLKPYSDPERSRYTLDGEPIRVGPQYATSLLMAFHELATNAAKFGALSNDDGRVAIAWMLTEPPKARALLIQWRESGGPPVRPRRRRGFGSRLIEGLAREIQGRVDLEFERSGVICDIEISLPPDGEGIGRAE
jgi:two-component sensor histidine kinase